MIIDAHQHVNWLGLSDADVIANMDKHGIDKSWILTWEGPADERDLYYARVGDPRFDNFSLAAVVEACRKYPDRMIPGYAPDPRDPRSVGRLEAAVEMFNIKVYGEWKYRMPVDSPECIEIFQVCGRLGLPVIIHMDVPFLPPVKMKKPVNYWYGGTIENFERAVQACPDTIFLGHGPGFWRYLSGDGHTSPEVYPKGEWVPGGQVVPLLRKYPNLYCDLSAGSALTALGRNLDFTREIVDEFQDRLLFARDYTDGAMHDFLVSLNLSKEISEKIFFRNALRLVYSE